MASKINSHVFYVPITPYKVESVEDQYNELSVRAGYNEYIHWFYVSIQAGWKTTFGHGCMIMGGSDPLTASTSIRIKYSDRNSQKCINEMGASLEAVKDDIVWLFDRRKWTELSEIVKDAAQYGPNMIAQRMKKLRASENENTNNSSSTKKEETMTKNLKAADLIGKVFIVGDNIAKVNVTGINGDKIVCEFLKGDAPAMPLEADLSQVQSHIDNGLWKLEGDAPKAEEPKGKAEDPKGKAEEPKGKAEEPKKKAEKPEKVKTDAKTVAMEPDNGKKKDEPKGKTEEPKAKYVYETYTNKKNKTCAKIMYFNEGDDILENPMAIHASASPKTVNGKKVFYLTFGRHYAAVAKDICDALNAGKALKEIKALVDKATKEREEKQEERKQEREAKKAEKSNEKTYTAAEVEKIVRGAFKALADAMEQDVKEFEPLIVAALGGVKKAA